jgi:hypothetical protein
MAQDSIDKVLASRQPASTAAPAEEGDKFYSVLVGEGVTEHFLELKFRTGMRTCFSYDDLIWFNYDPEGGFMDLEFGGYLVTVKGRGFGDIFFNHLRQKRVAWIAEADVEMQDHQGNKLFIQEITITPPSAGEEAEQPAKE